MISSKRNITGTSPILPIGRYFPLQGLRVYKAAPGSTKRGHRQYKGWGPYQPRPGVLTKELQWHNDQPEEHHYDYHRGKRFPAHYTPPNF
jgi:hypothetical protein